MGIKLVDRLMGAWTLMAYVELNTEVFDADYPMGEDPQGILLFTQENYMSVQIMNPNRNWWSNGFMFDASDEDYRRAASTYIAYSGTFHVDEDKSEINNFINVSLYPNWSGQIQNKVIKLEDNILLLTSTIPVSSNGIMAKYQMKWKRAPFPDFL